MDLTRSLTVACGCLMAFSALAQESMGIESTDSVTADDTVSNTILVNPLFDYPVAPEEIVDLKGKTNYLMLNFWKPMDLKKKGAVDQNALNHAFSVWTATMPHADREVVLQGVDELLKSLKKNPTLLLQFTKAAEESIYGPRATMWIDEVYLKFLDALSESKKIDKSRKARYEDQRMRLASSMQGNKLQFDYIDREGNPTKFSPIAKANIIEFGNPDCDDCRHSKILMEVDLNINELIENGLVSISFINVEEIEPEELSDIFVGYPKNWNVGSNPDLVEKIDIREYPSFYVTDGEGVIIAKNLNVVQAMALARQKAEE